MVLCSVATIKKLKIVKLKKLEIMKTLDTYKEEIEILQNIMLTNFNVIIQVNKPDVVIIDSPVYNIELSSSTITFETGGIDLVNNRYIKNIRDNVEKLLKSNPRIGLQKLFELIIINNNYTKVSNILKDTELIDNHVLNNEILLQINGDSIVFSYKKEKSKNNLIHDVMNYTGSLIIEEIDIL